MEQIYSLGVDFINILQAAIMSLDAKSANKDYQVISQFALLESTDVKAACKQVGEINPRSTNTELTIFKAELPQSFSTCVY